MRSLYLRARWFVGAGLLLLPVALTLIGDGPDRAWVLAAAGAVVLVHAIGLAVWGLEAVVSTLFIDLTVVHLATMVLSVDQSDHSAVLLTMVGFSVLIMLFTRGAARWAALGLNTAFSFVTLGLADRWALGEVIGSLMGGLFVVAIVISVLASFMSRLTQLEVARAVTLGIASHELRNRLTGVIGVTQLLAESDLEQEESKELLEMAHREAVEAGAVIDDLLTASRTERGVVETSPVPTDLARLVRNVVGTFGNNGPSLQVAGVDEPVWVLGDPLRAPQVLRNLISNADRYGGPDLRVVVTSGVDSVSVMVSDNGEGVHPQDVPNLFTPYHRSKERPPVHGSTGLGLWISRNLMRSMGGDLTYRRIDDRTVFEAAFRPAPPPRQS